MLRISSSPIRRAEPLREIRNDRTVCFGSDAVARLLMWLVLFFLIMRLIDVTTTAIVRNISDF